MSIQPTFVGFIQSTTDALLLFQATISGVLPPVSRRPHDRERADLIRSGHVFIFNEHESGIKRWTDGIAWSPSRILGNFLVYRELEKPFPPGEKKRTANRYRKKNSTSMRPSPYIKPSPPDEQQQQALPSLLQQNSEAAAAALFSPVDPIPDAKDQHRPFPEQQNMLPPPPRDHNNTAAGIKAERQLVGSLVDSYGFKDHGLIKKTMSIMANGSHHHLVSYYRPEDVISGAFTVPSRTQGIKELSLSEEITRRQNFRVPLENSDNNVSRRQQYHQFQHDYVPQYHHRNRSSGLPPPPPMQHHSYQPPPPHMQQQPLQFHHPSSLPPPPGMIVSPSNTHHPPPPPSSSSQAMLQSFITPNRGNSSGGGNMDVYDIQEQQNYHQHHHQQQYHPPPPPPTQSQFDMYSRQQQQSNYISGYRPFQVGAPPFQDYASASYYPLPAPGPGPTSSSSPSLPPLSQQSNCYQTYPQNLPDYHQADPRKLPPDSRDSNLSSQDQNNSGDVTPNTSNTNSGQVIEGDEEQDNNDNTTSPPSSSSLQQVAPASHYNNTNSNNSQQSFSQSAMF